MELILKLKSLCLRQRNNHRSLRVMTLFVPLLKSCTTQRSLLSIHGHLLATGRHRNALLSTKLIESYARMGSIAAARLVFDHFSAPDPFMWGVMIKCCVWNRRFREAVSLYRHGTQHCYDMFELSGFVFTPVLDACSGLCAMPVGRKIHGSVIKTGFEPDAVVATALLRMYGECGSLEDAYRTFDGMPARDVVSWNSMISSCVRCGQAGTALALFCEMNSEDAVVEHDSVMIMTVLEACADAGFLTNVKAVHGHLLRRRAEADELTESSLVATYGRCGDLASGKKVFGTASKRRSVVSWTAMISSYNQRGCFGEALDVCARMLMSEVEPNSVTMIGVLSSCTQLGLLKQGKSAHGFVVRRGADPHLDSTGSALIAMYSSFGKLGSCWSVFESMDKTTTLLPWNSLAAACARNSCAEGALELFISMLGEGLLPDPFALANALSACARLGEPSFGNQVHGVVTKIGCGGSRFVQNSLVDVHCRCGAIDAALEVFEEMEQKDVVAWNTMIGGLSLNGRPREAIYLFDQMCERGVETDSVTLLSAIKACTRLGSLAKGRSIHQKVVTSGLREDRVETAMVDMYAKCGDVKTARRVFDGIREKNVVSWSSIISGYGSHGMAGDAVSLFSRMVSSGTRPNEVTFTGVLSACGHAGLVEEGMLYFGRMKEEFGIEPQPEHCAAVVDLLSRAGQMDRAFDFVERMGVEPPSGAVWRALLNGCHIHRRQDMVDNMQRRMLNQTENWTCLAYPIE